MTAIVYTLGIPVGLYVTSRVLVLDKDFGIIRSGAKGSPIDKLNIKLYKVLTSVYSISLGVVTVGIVWTLLDKLT